MNKSVFKLIAFSAMFFYASAASAQTDIYYSGKTMVIPAVTDKLIEIIMPENYINIQPDVPEEQVNKYIAIKSLEKTNRLFVKFLRSDYPTAIHLWGAETGKSYVIRADFLNTSPVDDVYRIISDVYTKEKLNAKAPSLHPKENTYIERAAMMGKDMSTSLNDSSYTIYDNQVEEVLKSFPSFRFVLTKTYLTDEFVGYIIDVYNDLPVAQPFDLRNIYIPGSVMATINKRFLQAAPTNDREFLLRDYKAQLKIIFDLKNKEFRDIFYAK